jgi:ATP-dependent protease HslVU (ClpYQ) peptidase subunit
MSVVAYKNGVMVSDSHIATNGLIVGNQPKVRRRANILVGACGNSTHIHDFLTLYDNAPNSVENFPEHKKHTVLPVVKGFTTDFTGIVALPDLLNSIHIFSNQGSFLVDFRSDHGYAIGSGGQFASALMMAGMEAIEAVKNTITRIQSCGGSLQIIKHEEI